MIVRIPGNGDHKIARIAWAMFTGSDPFPLQVDHIDQNPLNNRIENLRLANQAENIRNRSVLPNNIAGLKGVSLKKPGKYQARITKNYKTFHLGYFATKDEAYNAYKNACKILHQQFASY